MNSKKADDNLEVLVGHYTPEPLHAPKLTYGFRSGHPRLAVICLADDPDTEVCQFFHDPRNPDAMPNLCVQMVTAFNAYHSDQAKIAALVEALESVQYAFGDCPTDMRFVLGRETVAKIEAALKLASS